MLMKSGQSHYLCSKPRIFASLFKKSEEMPKYLLIAVAFIAGLNMSIAQSFGIRAGLNATSIYGPRESGVNEQFGLSGGFHFGVNYAYKFTNKLALKGELLYTQIGGKYNYDGESYYKFPISNAFVFKKGISTIDMKISNAYISIPITFQWQTTKKVELFAGGYLSLLVGPRGNGTIEFLNDPDSLFFRQSLIHNYNKDLAGGIATSNLGPSVWVDGKVVQLARDVGAYYNLQNSEKVGNLYRGFDIGLTGGVNYFFNKGFYGGFRVIYGLRDVTNNEMDFLRKTYDEENNLDIRSNHFDRNIGYEFSLGFRF